MMGVAVTTPAAPPYPRRQFDYPVLSPRAGLPAVFVPTMGAPAALITSAIFKLITTSHRRMIIYPGCIMLMIVQLECHD